MHIFVRYCTEHMWHSQEFYLLKHHSMYCSLQNLGYIAMLVLWLSIIAALFQPFSYNYNDHSEWSHAAEWHRLMVIFVYAFDLVKPPLVPCMQRSLLYKKYRSVQKTNTCPKLFFPCHPSVHKACCGSCNYECKVRSRFAMIMLCKELHLLWETSAYYCCLHDNVVL